MTDCDAMRESLQAFLDGELGGADRARVEAHLDGCAACRRRASRYRRLFLLLEDPAVPEASPALTAAVMRRVAAGRARDQRWQRWVAAAAVALVVAAGTLLAWGHVGAAHWLPDAELSLTGLGQSLAEVLEGLGEWRLEWSIEWMPTLPGAPVVGLIGLALLVGNAALAWRWRGLARLNGDLRRGAMP